MMHTRMDDSDLKHPHQSRRKCTNIRSEIWRKFQLSIRRVNQIVRSITIIVHAQKVTTSKRAIAHPALAADHVASIAHV